MYKRRLWMVMLASFVFLAVADTASAVQGICAQCQYRLFDGRHYCYWTNFDGYQQCGVIQGGRACWYADECWGL